MKKFKRSLVPIVQVILIGSALLGVLNFTLKPNWSGLLMGILLLVFPIYSFWQSTFKKLETRWLSHAVTVPSLMVFVFALAFTVDSADAEFHIWSALGGVHFLSVVLMTHVLPRVHLKPMSLNLGQLFPDFVFEDVSENPITRSSLGSTPMLLFFFRGNWCPFCMAQLKQLIDNYKKIESSGTRLVFISSQPQDEMIKLSKQHGLNFVFLRDADFGFSRQYDLIHTGGVPQGLGKFGEDTILPTLIFLDQRGKILLIQRTDNVRLRPDPGIFLEKINQLGMNAFLEEQVTQRTMELAEEKEKSEQLLLNILPEYIALELKEKGLTQARYYEEATVLYTDFSGFTKISSQLRPQELLDALNVYFLAYDKAVKELGIEKIKTIGDAYMAVGGIPVKCEDHALICAKLALRIVEIHNKLKHDRQGLPTFDCRIGLHTGPIVAGIVGELKFCYDVWGDTVNLAARMEAAAEVGGINISEKTRKALGSKAVVESRGKVKVKNHEDQEMFTLLNILEA